MNNLYGIVNRLDIKKMIKKQFHNLSKNIIPMK